MCSGVNFENSIILNKINLSNRINNDSYDSKNNSSLLQDADRIPKINGFNAKIKKVVSSTN